MNHFAFVASVALAAIAGAFAGAHAQDSKKLAVESLTIAGPDGKPRGTFSIAGDAVRLEFLDGASNRRLAAETAADGTTSIKLADGKTTRLALQADKSGTPTISLAHADGTPRIWLLLEPASGAAALHILGDKMKLRGSLMVNEKGDPKLELYDPEEKPLWKAP